MAKTIKVTHIDTGGHGYVSISKKDFLRLNIPLDKISGYSGHNLTRMYLEEDCDAGLIFDAAKAMDVLIVVKSGYNLKFKCTHNYDPKLFAWQPKKDDVVFIGDEKYTIAEVLKSKLIMHNAIGQRFRLPLANIFNYISTVKGINDMAEESAV